MKEARFEDLVGKTLTSVNGKVGEERMTLVTDDGRRYLMYHEQDCCESVSIEDICGDLEWLIGSPILSAEESTSRDGAKPDSWADSFTWTFYRIATEKGMVVIRWYGSSNGYYSESVYFMEETL